MGASQITKKQEVQPRLHHKQKIFYLSQCNVAAISQRRNDKSRSVTQIFVIVEELGVTNVGETVVQIVIPTMPVGTRN